MNTTSTYVQRRSEIEHYFDRTAADTWERLTSDAPVSRIRATVRAGRDRMRETLLSWLPTDLAGRRVLDAGCGTGSFAIELARRGAAVTAIDLSPQLVEVAATRYAEQRAQQPLPGHIEFRSGDMSADELGSFDHVVAMDSLIHYQTADALRVLQAWAPRVRHSMVFTFAPASPALLAMHAVGRLFPRGDRAPAIEPVAESALRRLMTEQPALAPWSLLQTLRIKSGFYTSQAFQLTREA
jgi:magnesium-protoporphyrin O-methyltransferase